MILTCDQAAPLWRAKSAKSLIGLGRGGGARTPDPRIWRPMHYQLSYTPKAERLVVGQAEGIKRRLPNTVP